MSRIPASLREALHAFDQERLVEATERALEQGYSPQDLLEGLTEGLREVGDRFEKGELFLAELVAAGEAAKKVIAEYLKPMLEGGGEGEPLGHIVIGTVAGDIHDIGKGIVGMMLFTAGFEVKDLGVDVPAEMFVQAVREEKPDVIAMSALLTTTLPMQRETIEALEKSGLRNTVKVIVGGSPVTSEWADEIGADGYAEDAVGAVKLVKEILGIRE
ncbi:corrinoid protein [Candidatus Bathyarchaeota archaeon]|nr:corrinoid protein [Candidatus Bathyarchaeota archaeon]